MNTETSESLQKWFDLLENRTGEGTLIELPVLSGSMMKEVVPGKTVKIRIIKAFWRLRVGDIIVFKHGLKLYSHRVLIRLNLFGKRLIYQKGDINPGGGWIDGRNVIGKVVESVDFYGRKMDYTQNRMIFRARIKAMFQLMSIPVLSIIHIIKNTIKFVLYYQ